MGSQSYTTPGTYTFTPAYDLHLTSECYGAGGGGGGGAPSNGASGGEGGGYGKDLLRVVPAGTVVTIVVGAGGTPGANMISNGGKGGDSYISISGTVVSKGVGGNGGLQSGNSPSASSGNVGSPTHRGGISANSASTGTGSGGGSRPIATQDGNNSVGVAGALAPDYSSSGGNGGYPGSGYPGIWGGGGGGDGYASGGGGYGGDGFITLTWTDPTQIIMIQHISDRILKAMNRPYGQKTLRDLIKKIHSTVPEAALRTTLMVGFPGERDEDFQELLQFVAETAFDHLGVFRYSPEEGTLAAGYPDQVPEEIGQRRMELLMSRQKEISLKKNQRRIGSVEPLLVGGISPESELLIQGRTRFQAPDVDGVVFIADGEPKIGEMVKVKITEAHAYDLVGVVFE